MPRPPKTDEWRRGDAADRGADAEDETPPAAASLPPWKILAATALVATVLGAGIGTAMTLLVGEPGPRGEQGERGVQGPAGPQGPRGPAVDTSGLEIAIDDLNGQVADLQSRVDSLESTDSDVSDDEIASLEERIIELEDLVSALCFELDFSC